MEKIISSLTRIESTVLKALKSPLTDREISKRTNLKNIEVLRGISWLESKSLVKVKNSVKEIAELTQTGKNYLENGLPEDKILGVLVLERGADHKQIMKKAGIDDSEFRAGVGILRKAGMIKFDSGIIKITKKGESQLKSKNKYLETMKGLPSEVKKINEKITELKRRGIVSLEIQTTKHVALTNKGINAFKRIKNVEMIDRITPSVIKKNLWKDKKIRRYDVRAKVPKKNIGKKQPYLAFLDELKNKLVRLGFKEMKGPVVETNFWNCDALFMPQDHPARGIHDIYYVKKPKSGNVPKDFLKKVGDMHEKGLSNGKGWNYNYSEKTAKEHVLRSQGTSLSARMLANPNLEIPGKYFSIARCFRPDSIDWKHLTEFNQVEGIIVAEDLNMKHLMGVLKMFATEIAGAKKFKVNPDYYPFTEPSVELSVYFPKKGWVELGGSGIFRPEVTKPFGIDVPVIAWGLGVDRIFMMKHGINDIRQLFSSDLDWLRRES